MDLIFVLKNVLNNLYPLHEVQFHIPHSTIESFHHETSPLVNSIDFQSFKFDGTM